MYCCPIKKHDYIDEILNINTSKIDLSHYKRQTYCLYTCQYNNHMNLKSDANPQSTFSNVKFKLKV